MASHAWDRRYKVVTGSDGSEFVSPEMHEFIEFLITPNRGTLKAYAESKGLVPSTLSAWKRERFFKEEWERQARKLNVGIERIQNVVDAMYSQAISGDTKAMSMYLQYVKEFIPTTKVITEDRSVKDLTDEELAAQLEGTVTQLRTVRSADGEG